MASTQSSRAQQLAGQADRSRQVAAAAAQIAHDNRGQNIVLLDLRHLTAVFDFFLVVTGTSHRQLHAIAEEIRQTLKERFGEKQLGIEGFTAGNWILLDYGDIVIHLFDEPAREYYCIEQLWSDGKKVDWQAAAGPRIAKLD